MINVRDVPYLLDLDGTPIKALNNREHLEIEHKDNESSVMTLIYDIEETFITEQQIIYRENRYIISEIEQQKSSRTTTITAEIAYLELADKNVTINAIDELLEEIAQKAIDGTKWTIGTVADLTTKHNMIQEDVSSLSVLRLLARIAELKLVFDTINYKVHFLEDDANDVGFLFRYRKNLSDITKTTFAPKATTLIPFGKGGLTIESVNNGVRYVEDFSWYESLGYTKSEARRLFNKVHTFSDERFVYAGNLMREAERRLRTLAHPQIAYEVSVSHLDKDIKIGDYGYVVDEELGIKVKVKVVRLVEYEDINDNQIELNYLIPGLADVEESELETSMYEPALQTVFVQNESEFVGDDNFKLLLSMTITNYASTHAQLGLAIVGQASTNALLELYFDIDGRKHDFEVKQVIQPGYNTIALPMLFTQIQEGSHLLNVFLKVDNGTFIIERHDAQMFVQAENLQGGLATTMPRANVVEEVEFPFTKIDVTDTLVEIEIDGMIYTDEPPGMPTGVTYTVDIENNEVKIEWNENTEEFLLGYNIYVDGVKHNDEIIVDTEYTVTGLEEGKTYFIELKAQSIWGVESEPYVIEVEIPRQQTPEEKYFPLPTEVITEYNNWLITFISEVEHPVMYATDGTFVANYDGYNMRIHNSSRRSRWDWIDNEWVLTDYHFDWENSNSFTYQDAILSSVDITDYNTGEVLFNKLENSEIPMIEDRREHYVVPELPHVEGLTEYVIIHSSTYRVPLYAFYALFVEPDAEFYWVNDISLVSDGSDTNDYPFIAASNPDTRKVEKVVYGYLINNWIVWSPLDVSNGVSIGADIEGSKDIYGIIYNTKPILDKNGNVILPARRLEEAIMPRFGLPPMPTGVTHTIEDGAVKLEWDENEGYPVVGCNVYVNGFKHNSGVIVDTQYIITGLNDGESYSIELRAQTVWGVESVPYVIEIEIPGKEK